MDTIFASSISPFLTVDIHTSEDCKLLNSTRVYGIRLLVVYKSGRDFHISYYMRKFGGALAACARRSREGKRGEGTVS